MYDRENVAVVCTVTGIVLALLIISGALLYGNVNWERAKTERAKIEARCPEAQP